MALVLNEEQRMLKESVRDFVIANTPISALRALRDSNSKDGFDRAVWKGIAELGIPGVIIPESYGGIDFGYIALGQALEETGRALVSSPLISSVLLSTTIINLLGTEAQKQALLPDMSEGKLLVAFAHEELAKHTPSHVATTATLKGDTYEINGNKTFVLDAHVSDKLIVVARINGALRDKDGISLFLVDKNSEGVTVQKTQMLDYRNAAKIEFKNVVVPVSDELVLTSFEVLERIYAIGAIGIAAEMLGGVQECFERTIAYLKEREQFGVAIGSFQALQHRAAKMFTEVELSKSIIIKALKAIDENDENLLELASLAKSKLGMTFKLVSNEGVQMHGGVGMTDDVEIGFFIKRARVAQQTFGDYHYHLDRFASINAY